MNWQALISTVAPWIGTALGGPLGGAAIGAVADALGLSDKTEASIKTALAGVTPEQMLAIKSCDQQFQVKMQELGYQSVKDLETLADGDRDSARKREMTVKDITPKLLALVVTLGFFGTLAFMMLHSVPTESRDVLNIMLGSLGTAWVSIIAYYFGSSSGSDRKTELLSAAPAK